MTRSTLIAAILLAAAGPTGRTGEAAALPEREIPPILAVTGFHSLEDKANKLEVRLLEADASSTVAKNPVVLFVVVTDNAPDDDSQTRIWRLPDGVSVVKKFTGAKNGAQIAAVVDGQMDEKTGRFPSEERLIDISYGLNKGVLSDKLRVSTSKP